MPVLSEPVYRIRTLKVVIVVTIAAYVAASLWSGWNEVIEAIARVGIVGVMVGCVMTLINIILRFLRWNVYLKLLGAHVYPATSLKIYVAGFALATTPGGAGEPLIRSIFLKPYAFAYGKTVAAYLSERVSDIVAMLIITTVGLSTYPAGRPLLAGVTVAILAFIVIVRGQWLEKLHRPLEMWRGRWVKMLRHGLDALQDSRASFQPKVFASGLIVGIIAWSANAASLYYIMHLVGFETAFPIALYIYSFSVLVGGLSFIPGGVGTAEAVMIALLIFHAMPEAQAVAVAIVHRLVTLWFSVLLGVCCYYSHGRGGNRRHIPPAL
jgi:glycosyltransferase 2 family protein